MKAKKLEKKLILSKSTVSDLNSNEMNKVKGGEDTFPELFVKQLTALSVTLANRLNTP